MWPNKIVKNVNLCRYQGAEMSNFIGSTAHRKRKITEDRINLCRYLGALGCPVLLGPDQSCQLTSKKEEEEKKLQYFGRQLKSVKVEISATPLKK